MKNFIAFLIILILLVITGSVWGIYEFQTAHGMKTAQTLAIVKAYFVIQRPKAPEAIKLPENKPAKEAEVIRPREKFISQEAPSITPFEEAPITPPKIDFRRAPKIEKPKVTAEAQPLVEDGNKYYDAGVVHLQNTFKKDETFDKENELAIEELKQALAKYLEAEKIDPDSLWLRNKIRETNGNLVTCSKQARRK